MRRANGTCGIYKLSGNRRRPWMVNVTIGWTDDGKQLRKPIGYFSSRTAAEKAAAEYLETPYSIDSRKYTLFDLYNAWAKNRYINKDEDIPHQYAAAFKFCDTIKEKLFCELKTQHLQKVIDSCPKGYSTKKNIKILLNQIYKYALANDIANKNYAELVKLPPQVLSRLHQPFTEDELSLLWQHQENRNVRMVLILCYTGLRPTELLKIETANVFLDERYMLGGIKTAAGKNRVIPIAEKIYPFIQELYKPETATLVHNDRGRAINYDKFRSLYWNPAMTALKLTHLPHDGRHTCATMLDNAGVNKKAVQLILGHTTTDITDKVYTHKTIQQLIDAINSI